MKDSNLRASAEELHSLAQDEKYFVYILICNDGSSYTGCTNNLKERLKRHYKGEVNYTSSRLPVEVKTYVVFDDKYKAYDFEKYLKSGSGRAFMKKRLI